MLKKRVASAVATTLCTGLLVTGVVAANPGGSTDPERSILVRVEDEQKTVDSKVTEKSTAKDSSAIKEEKKNIETTKNEDKKKTKEKKIQKEDLTNTKKKQTADSSANTNAGTSSSKPINTTPSGSGGSQTPPTQPSKPTHSHDFSIPITQTINHPAEYTEIYHPEVGHEIQRCKGCGIVNPDSAHKEAHLLAGEPSGTYGDWIVDQDAWTERVKVKDAWTEQIITGYQCSCGAKR